MRALVAVEHVEHDVGPTVRGVERSTFVIDAKGTLVKEWRGVKVAGHVNDVLEFVEGLA